MGESTVNGDMPHSAIVDHITGYPVVKDTFSTFKKNPYGAKLIEIENNAFDSLVKPVFPYLETPASYVKPYAAKADELGDSFLTKFDEKIPILKTETADIKKTTVDYVTWPFKVVGEQKDYIFKTYSNEYKKCGGDGVVAGSKALVSSGFVITSDWMSYFATFLQQKKEEAKEAAEQAKAKVDEKTSD